MELTTAPGRNLSIDLARGLAIFLMVPANMAATVYAEPHPWWFRIISSFAAPTFIFLAGMMIGVGSLTKKHTLRHFMARGGVLLGIGALVDMLIWNLIPFCSYDVLYLIGIGCPLTYLFIRMKPPWRWVVMGAIFAGTPLLQTILGYTDYPSETYLWGSEAGKLSVVARNPTSALQHLLVDGWFPLFPWLGFCFLGAHIGRRFNFPQENTDYSRIGHVGGALFLFGAAAWWWYPGLHYVRAGYSEMFYPATPGFILTAVGFVMLVLRGACWNPGSWWYAPLRWLGESSLPIYISHYLIIHFGLETIFPGRPLGDFLLINFVSVLFLVLIAWSLRQLKNKWRDRPFLVKVVLG